MRRETSAIKGDDVYQLGEKKIERDDAFYRYALSRIPETDHLIPHLRSPLAYGAAEQWHRAKAELTPLPDGGRKKRITEAMRSARQIDRISTLVAILAAAERGDEDARLAIVDDLLDDLVFAETSTHPRTLLLGEVRSALHDLTDRARWLKGDLGSPNFFRDFLRIAGQYADVVRAARTVVFSRVSRDIDFSPPRFGDELFIFGAGANGLVPWMYASAVQSYLDPGGGGDTGFTDSGGDGGDGGGD